jgi:diguanylate cyclase (GGDEF)-like protein/PAS domain S-box-containing protein
MRRLFSSTTLVAPDAHAIAAPSCALRFDELFGGLPLACVRFDERGRILDWNAAAVKLYGWSLPEATARTIWETLVREEDAPRLRTQISRVFGGEATRDLACQQRCANGHEVSVQSTLLPLRDARDKVVCAVMTTMDISERKRAEERLARHAFHDRLTNLPDRTLFAERVEQALRRTRQSEDYEFAVFFLNLDRFKIANESLGIGAGDQLLAGTARKLEACVAPDDMVARLGGDEFAILLDDIKSDDDAIQVAERIQKRLALPMNFAGQEVYSTASIGIAFNRAGHTRAEEILRDAHAAMDRAKSAGKARYEIFDKGMPSRARANLQLESDLRRALGRHELQLNYQPIISFATGLIDGFEALVRWNHPTRGMVSPGQFVPLAEETGLIIPIGYWALREACNQLAYWQKVRRPRTSPLTIAVNLSAKQFSQPNLVDQVKAIVKRTDVDASYLKLEIVESAIMDNTAAAIGAVTQLKEMGIKISLDDFGTGYSSLSYLHKFPFNVLKIDQSFVSKMDISNKHEDIVRAIIALGHSLRMDVVAEGVETNAQLAQLRSLKCHYGQGYFFAGAMDAASAQEFVAANPQW